MEEKRLQASQSLRLECHFKVAKGLWDAWQIHSGESRENLTRKMQDLGGVDADGTLRWIDEADRLTWYRGLSIVMVMQRQYLSKTVLFWRSNLRRGHLKNW
ncbi:MAG: hypothetical protein HQL49_10165 [Gammaproteobacteria bacterium]|nr:hypothetical protein [Gammaproteobacteria bacterium]